MGVLGCWDQNTGRQRDIGESKSEYVTLVSWQGGHAVQREPRRSSWKIISPVLGPNSLMY